MDHELYFWGTRGSLPVNGARHHIYGGNTSCIEIRRGKNSVIFDGGSGLLPLGNHLITQDVSVIDIVFSHFHADHICGLPFFKPLFDRRFHIRFHCFDARSHTNRMRTIFNDYIRPPVFPMTSADFKARVDYLVHDEAYPIKLYGWQLSALAIPHPGGTHALRLRHANTSIVYATDTEHTPHTPNQQLINFMHESDLTIYDCTYDDAEFNERKGWGHSTWQEGIRLAQAANATRLAIFHHEPDRSDQALATIEAKAQRIMPTAFVVHDHQKIVLKAE